MSNSPLRDWFGRLLAAPAPSIVYEEHHVTRAPGQYGNVPVDGSRTFQSVSATQENNLLVTLFSAFDATITVTGLIHRPNNEFTPIGPGGKGFQLAVKGDRAIYQSTLTLGSSIGVANLNLVISSASVNVPVNGCWAIVQTVRPLPDGSSATTSTLLSGPVTLLQPLAYPGSPVQKTADSTGFHRVIDVAAPVAGQEISITVPQGARWQVNTLNFTLVTNATAGNREMLVRYTSGATSTPQTEFTVEAQGTLQPASTTGQYAYGATLSPQVSVNFGSGAGSSTRQQGLPGNRFLLSGESIVTQTAALAAGDQYGGIVIGVIEVLDPTAPAGTLQPILTFTGTVSGSQNLAINPVLVFNPGAYTVTVNVNMTIHLPGVAGGSGGQVGGASNVGVSGGVGGVGGGGGAIASGVDAILLLVGKSYTLNVGAGGASNTAGGDTKLTNTTDGIVLLWLHGGTLGAGGAITVGTGTAGSAGGGAGSDTVGPNNNGFAGTGGAGLTGGGGGGGAGQFNRGAGTGGAGGGGNDGTHDGAAGSQGGASAAGAGGHGGTGVSVTGTAGVFGAGGGGGGGGGGDVANAGGAGGAGKPGVAVVTFVSAP